MAEWQTPKTDWGANPRPPVREDFDRIEGNTEYLYQLGFQPMRNVLINGALDFWQRGASGSTVGGAGYSADRWVVADGTEWERSTDTPNNTIEYSIHLTRGSGTNVSLSQRIESANSRHLVGESTTVSFWAKTPNMAQLEFLLAVPQSKNNFEDNPDNEQIIYREIQNVQNTGWNQYVFTFDQLPPSVSNGLLLLIRGITGSLPYEIYFTNVQLEKGSIATPFEYRPIGTELSLCQRYFAKTYDLDTAPGTATANGSLQWASIGGDAGSSATVWQLPANMRMAPVTTIYSTTGEIGTIRNYVSSANISGEIIWAGERQLSIRPVNNNDVGDGDRLAVHATADAEL